MIPLFVQYPRLRQQLPYVSLGDYPTPVQKLERLGNTLGIEHLYVKRDDLTGAVYGGNKPRKLEFLLGEALRANRTTVLTIGYAGSNHALATAIYAHHLGLRSISMLLRQPNARYVRSNLMLQHYFCAEMHHYESSPALLLGAVGLLARHRLQDRVSPLIIPAGGSSALGSIGYVNAALELKRQVEQGLLPTPNLIYVAAGTLGTAVGLMLGLQVCGLKSRVVSIRVATKWYATVGTIVRLYNRLNAFLHSEDSSFPRLDINERDIELRHEFFGMRYGLFTEQGQEAVALMKRREGIQLEGTYTGKTLAALIADGMTGRSQPDEVILFWNTYNSRNYDAVIANLDYRQLPEPLHWYFEHPVQQLDQNNGSTG